MSMSILIPEISERAVTFTGLFTFVICLYVWVKTKEGQSLSWALVSFMFALTYAWIAIYEPTEFEKKWLVRLDVVGLFFTIAYWHVYRALCYVHKRRMLSHETK